ncbi:diguanylate cyclase [Fibrobacter sp. UWB12]|uniref:GGDEF domain-containing protein n=1 Tax=Fibrobacter sp. UWB12 TaxID=1896203 RepID=UPI0009163CFA|nr:GGDEF domain-containing protein [Fibrobacter sp. UWB12]SHK69327.1 diguanylate cyclase (GGDEF) domain-containing protein [Fibrobacter sp. UWB12]
MGDYKKFIADFPVDSAEFFTAITYATTELYISMHVLDLENNTAFPIKTNEFIDKFMKCGSTLQESITNIMVNLACPESVSTIKNFTILSTLSERMKNANVISEIFHGKIHGWSKAMFVRVGDDKPLRRVLYVVENVNAQMTKLEQEKELLEQNRKQQNMINALMDGFASVVCVDFATEKVEFFRASDRIKSAIGFMKEPPPFKALVDKLINTAVLEEDRDNLWKVAEESYIKEHLQVGNSLSQIFHNELGQYIEMKVVRTGEETTVFGFTDKHNEITEINDKIYKDSLTQVMNRKYFDDKLAPCNFQAVVMADIDFFKEVNDNYGHQCGDAALAAVASILSSSVRSSDCVVRYGGDEFLISFKGIAPEVLKNRLEQMRAKAEKIKLQDYPNVQLTMSFGGTYGDGTVSDMLSFADEALYVSKKKRNCVTLVPFEEKN